MTDTIPPVPLTVLSPEECAELAKLTPEERAARLRPPSTLTEEERAARIREAVGEDFAQNREVYERLAKR